MHAFDEDRTIEEQQAFERGAEAARNAASWTADGNNSPDTIRAAIVAMDEGDPCVEDYLPLMPALSGEWAGELDPLGLAQEITGDDSPSPEIIDALAAAFEEGVSETFGSACEAELWKHVPGEVVPTPEYLEGGYSVRVEDRTGHAESLGDAIELAFVMQSDQT